MCQESTSRLIRYITTLLSVGIFCTEPLFSQTTSYNDFGRIAGEYVNSCYGIDYLNAKYCDKSAKPETNNCINSVSQLVDRSISDQFQRVLMESLRTNQRRGTYENQLDDLMLIARSRSGDGQACQILVGTFESAKRRDFQRAREAARYLPKLNSQK
jgi:hypothetical protein